MGESEREREKEGDGDGERGREARIRKAVERSCITVLMPGGQGYGKHSKDGSRRLNLTFKADSHSALAESRYPSLIV